MIVVLLAVRLTGLEERRHGTWFANWLAYGAMSKASVPNPSIRGGVKEGGWRPAPPVKLLRSLPGP